jgi:ABC-type uncharacterized transport system involved in gliding motility auxiliary subunit
VTSYSNHPITKDFGNGFSFYPLARPVEVKPVDGVQETPLVRTSEQSWGESTPEKQPLQFDQQIDRPGPLTLGVALSRKAESSAASPILETQPKTSPEASPTPSPTGQPQASPSAVNKENTDKRTSESRLVVYGNSSFATDGWFEQQLNSDVFLNSIGWLSKRDEQTLSIRPKEQKNRRLNLTPLQAGALGWTALVIIPLVGFTTAGMIWWRRR